MWDKQATDAIQAIADSAGPVQQVATNMSRHTCVYFYYFCIIIFVNWAVELSSPFGVKAYYNNLDPPSACSLSCFPFGQVLTSFIKADEVKVKGLILWVMSLCYIAVELEQRHTYSYLIFMEKKRINPVSLHMRIRGVKLQINVQNTAGTFLF